MYGGWLHDHFGDFILSTLSRYWTPLWHEHPDLKIVYHSERDISIWFEIVWIGQLLRGLGLTPDRFVRFDKPTKIQKLIIPFPSFEEENFVHRAFARFCNELGRVVAGNRIAKPDNRPVYLSKERLPVGVRRLSNEFENTKVLADHGVEIVYPETLAIEDQIALWYNRPYIASFEGSAMHASVFAPGQHSIILTYNHSIISSYPLLDIANRSRTQYLSISDNEIRSEGARDGFHSVTTATDPIGLAESLLRALDFQQRSAASRKRIPLAPRSDYWTYSSPFQASPVFDTHFINLAIDKPTSQSSVHPWEVNKVQSATSGSLTGRYQFHTDEQDDPWWEVDLLEMALISAIKLYNRDDNSQERCSQFTISIKGNDLFYRPIYTQKDPIFFGGLTGTSFEWVADRPVEGRVIRISIPGRKYFHLDQVEIIGRFVETEIVDSVDASKRSGSGWTSKFFSRSKSKSSQAYRMSS